MLSEGLEILLSGEPEILLAFATVGSLETLVWETLLEIVTYR